VRFRYAVVRVSDELLLCEGETVHLVVDRDMKRRELPEQYAKQFQSLLHGTGSAREESKE
jgi:acyl-CoA thioester hydrolase